jgi:hyperosmotically inducible protein
MNVEYTKKLLGIVLGVMLITGGYARAQEVNQQKQEEMTRLANQIRKNILMLSTYGPFDFISFGITPADKGYQVILRGYASRPILKDSAENTVKRIEEVDAIDNQIEVLPTSRVDEDIRVKVYGKIYYNTVLSRYNPNYGTPIYGSARSFRNAMQMGISNDPPTGYHPISIIVNNGHVILEGVVNNEGDKSMAGMLANQVSGVFSVTNNLVSLQSEKEKKEK